MGYGYWLIWLVFYQVKHQDNTILDITLKPSIFGWLFYYLYDMNFYLSFILLLCVSNLIFASFPIVEMMPDPNEGLYKTVGYFMGMFLLIFGVIIAYAYNNKTMLKSAWKGFLTIVGAFIIYLTVLFVLYSYFPDDF